MQLGGGRRHASRSVVPSWPTCGVLILDEAITSVDAEAVAVVTGVVLMVHDRLSITMVGAIVSIPLVFWVWACQETSSRSGSVGDRREQEVIL
ncbi:MAG: hypothetical protein MUC51_16745 [Anaerolineae bacterium]|nr:hypothetical protein [Anaerolineae bacterium]